MSLSNRRTLSTVDYLFDDFRITDEEYKELDKKYGKLCNKAAWVLKAKNFNNNYTDEIEDVIQDLKWSMSRAYVYMKRQRYVEACIASLESCWENNPPDHIFRTLLTILKDLWDKRTRHGASRQRFGLWQEQVLEKLVNEYVPSGSKPDKKSKLEMDEDFGVYCKANIWNYTKNLGKKITRERAIRSGMASLSELEFLC